MLLPLLFTVASILQTSTTTGQPAPDFKCTASSTCQSLVGYKPSTSLPLSNITTLFQLSSFRTLLGPNNLPYSTSASHVITPNQTIRIPIPCRCSNGSGLSDHVPKYTVVKDDGLYNIANLKFGGLVTYQQIQKVNGIPDADLIIVGQKFWIPLPCSCDDVEGTRVIHYAHVVAKGSSVADIAAEFAISPATLMRINGISDPKKLVAGQVLDAPLLACSSKVNSGSSNYPVLLANNSYAYTANDCVKCSCHSSTNMTLDCESSGLKPTNWSTCPEAQCSNGLDLGETTTIQSCRRSRCAYVGFNDKNQTILTSLVQDYTCPSPSSGGGAKGAPSNSCSKINMKGWSLAFVVSSIQLIMIFFTFL